MSSESPTHPDAPRAGGETAAIDLEATRRLLAKIERDYRDSAYACDTSSFGSLGATRRRIADDVAQLRAALPSLLERHRDGERAQAVHASDARFINDVCRLYNNQLINAHAFRAAVGDCIGFLHDRRAKLPPLDEPRVIASAGPSPERASK